MGKILNIVATDFDIKQIMECGQVFRYIKNSDTDYIIFSGDRKLQVRQKMLADENFASGNNDFAQEKVYATYVYGKENNPKVLISLDCTEDEFEKYWKNYFDLETDYSFIKDQLAVHGEKLSQAIKHGNGIRILRQDVFETIIGFIVSANNNISRIQKIMFLLCENYGKKVLFTDSDQTVSNDKSEFDTNFSDGFYAFPTPENLAEADISHLRKKCNVGYRDKYIVGTSKLICSESCNIHDLKKTLSTKNLLEELKKLVGVGQKVADCIALFAYGRGEVFPVDVWTKKVFERLYIGHEIPKTQVHKKVHEIFGCYAGYAQQYLFYFGRENNW